MMIGRSILLAGLVHALTAPAAVAFTYQGQLKQNGVPVNGACVGVFTLWDGAVGGNQVGPTVLYNGLGGAPFVDVANGLFTVDLDFGDGAFDGAPRWLGIELGCPPGSPLTALSPRQPITPVPYALHTLEGPPSGPEGYWSANASHIHNNNIGNVGIGTTTPNRALHVYSGTGGAVMGWTDAFGHRGVEGISTFPDGVSQGIYGESAGNMGMGVYGRATSETGANRGVYGQSNSPQGFGVHGFAGSNTGESVGVLGEAWSTHGRGVQGIATAQSGANYGLFGETASSGGRGALGVATALTGATFGVQGIAASAGGIGVSGWATSATGTTYGFFGQSESTSGRGVYGEAAASSGTTYGVYGRSRSTSGQGVRGWASATSGTNHGVYGESAGTGGRGVQGVAASATGITFGVHGQSSSVNGRGVYGEAIAPSGTTYGVYGRNTGTSGQGVFGEATAASGSTIGVHGRSVSPGGWGVLGEVTANSGTNFGGRFISHSTSGRGVYGEATAASGTTYGVRGEVSSSDGRAVFGVASATSGINYGGRFLTDSPDGRGVYGEARAASGTTFAVRGEVASVAGYAAYFLGGRSYFQGHVGVGASIPNARLHVNGPSGEHAARVQVAGATKLLVASNGGVSIGANISSPPANGLFVQGAAGIGVSPSAIPAGVMLGIGGKVMCEELEIQLQADWPDYVFEEDYPLLPLDELEQAIRADKHLPGIPTAAEVKEKGVSVGQMQVDLLRKVEELTLYVIEMNKEVQSLKHENALLRDELASMGRGMH